MQYVQNILRVYHQAGAGEIDAGLRWYLTAREEAERLANFLPRVERTDSLVAVAAGIIAVLSPGLRWERNVEAAERVIGGESLIGLGVRWYNGVRKAERILKGERVGSVLSGRKVNSFYLNIVGASYANSVTVDGHAWAIWAGERRALDEVPSLTPKLYNRIEADYIAASGTVGILPHQLQAITWCTWRRLHGVASNHFLPLFENPEEGGEE